MNSCEEDVNVLNGKWLKGCPEKSIPDGSGSDGGGGIPG